MSKASVAAAEFNLQANGVSNAKIARLTAEEFTAAWTGAKEFERAKTLDLKAHNLQTILVDPPRAGKEFCQQFLHTISQIVRESSQSLSARVQVVMRTLPLC